MADLRGYVEGLIGFEGDGTNVIANPTGTPTDDLESIQIGETIYNVGGGGEEIVPTPTNVDRSKYLGVKSNANELEYRSINELPNSTGANAGDILTHTISGDSWLPPEKELPTYTTGDNGKVLGVSSGVLTWVEQSGGGGGVNYSTEEQDTGLTWIDGSHIYRKTYALASEITINNNTWTYVITNNDINIIIDCFGISNTGTFYSLNAYSNNGQINSLACRDGNPASVKYYTITYTKRS